MVKVRSNLLLSNDGSKMDHSSIVKECRSNTYGLLKANRQESSTTDKVSTYRPT
jgi:hypothetical protein